MAKGTSAQDHREREFFDGEKVYIVNRRKLEGRKIDISEVASVGTGTIVGYRDDDYYGIVYRIRFGSGSEHEYIPRIWHIERVPSEELDGKFSDVLDTELGLVKKFTEQEPTPTEKAATLVTLRNLNKYLGRRQKK